LPRQVARGWCGARAKWRLYVPPSDPDALRRAINTCSIDRTSAPDWAPPGDARWNAGDLDQYVRRLSALVEAA
jgi:hypothetical protein